MWKRDSCCPNFVSNNYEIPYDKYDRLHVQLLQPAVCERPETGLLSSKTDELNNEVPVPAMSSSIVYTDVAVMPVINVTRFHFCCFREI